jgi:hypothetical protein
MVRAADAKRWCLMKTNLVVRAKAYTANEPQQRSAYVAWLLRICVHDAFPCGVEHSREANEHLHEWVAEKLRVINEHARRQTKESPELSEYRRTVAHCNAIMEGQTDPAQNGWFKNKRSYRRGVYLPDGTPPEGYGR